MVEGLMVDALWREARVIVEVDGGDAHGTPAAVVRDRHRDMTLRTAGYLPYRYSWLQITRRTLHVAAELRGVLASRAPAGG